MRTTTPASAGDQALLDLRTAEGHPLEWCLHINGKNYGLRPADVREDAGRGEVVATHALEPRDRHAQLIAAWVADEVWDSAAQGLRVPGLEIMSPDSAGGRYLANLQALERDAAEKWKGTQRPQIEPLRIYSGPAPDRFCGRPWSDGHVAWWIVYRYGSEYILIARPPRPRD